MDQALAVIAYFQANYFTNPVISKPSIFVFIRVELRLNDFRHVVNVIQGVLLIYI